MKITHLSIYQAKIETIEEENQIQKSLEDVKMREEINSMNWFDL